MNKRTPRDPTETFQKVQDIRSIEVGHTIVMVNAVALRLAKGRVTKKYRLISDWRKTSLMMDLEEDYMLGRGHVGIFMCPCGCKEMMPLSMNEANRMYGMGYVPIRKACYGRIRRRFYSKARKSRSHYAVYAMPRDSQYTR